MKPPVRVWVTLLDDGTPVDVNLSRRRAHVNPGESCHRYRLDPPKRKASPARQNVAGGVIRKAKKRAGRRG